jgi:hypothetical protein
MPVSAATICQSGISYPQAIEITRQMNAGVGNAVQLVNACIHPQAATELARQINAVSFSSDLLARAGWHPEAAVQIKAQSGH